MKIKDNLIEILIITGVILLLSYSYDPVIYSDSSRYMEGSSQDPPLYSTIIMVIRLISGSMNFVVVLQTIFVGSSIIYFTKTVATHFNLNIIIKIFISLLLFLPILEFYNKILTESFAYAFSLFFVSFAFKLIFNFNIRNLIFTTFFVVLLLLTRNQFMILYPVILLLYLGILILHNSKKIFTVLIISFLSIFLIHNSLIFFNTQAKQDNFKTESLSYVSLGPFFHTYFDAIYISSAKDVLLFEDQNLQKTLNTIFEEMDNQKALLKYYNGRGHFGISLSKIKNYSKPLLKNLADQNDISVINLKKEISIKLIKANFRKYTKHIFKKSYDSSWLFVFLPFLIMLAGLTNFLKYKSHLSLLITFISTFSLANHSIIYLFGRVQPRYFIYTDFVLLIFIFILFNFFKKKKKGNEI